MPSAITVYSLPAQLGRRGTTAVVVVALHVVMALGFIAAMTIKHTSKSEPRMVVVPIPPQQPPERPIQRFADGELHPDYPPVGPVDVDPDDVVGPPVPVQQEAVTVPPTAEPTYVSQVRVLRDRAPLYPAAERRLAHEGVVTVRVKVGATGRAEEVEVSQSSGHQRLDDAALAAVRQWIFAPAQTATGPVVSWVTLTVRFQLTS